MKLPPAISWTTIGIIVGVCSCLLWQKNSEKGEPLREAKPVPEPKLFSVAENPNGWLSYPGASLGELFHNEEMLKILEAPEKISLHTRKIEDSPGVIDHDGMRFVSSYDGGGNVCAFDPLILVRLYRSGQTLDLLFCFNCHEMQAYLDQGKAASSMGLTELGQLAFIRHLHTLLPEHEVLKQLNDSYLRRAQTTKLPQMDGAR
jgi:hypothetical protein